MASLREDAEVSVKKFVAQFGGPARIPCECVARILAFEPHSIPILTKAKLLEPLGDPTPNGPKWFATVEIMRLAADRDWLDKATKKVSQYWKNKKLRRSPRNQKAPAEQIQPNIVA